MKTAATGHAASHTHRVGGGGAEGLVPGRGPGVVLVGVTIHSLVDADLIVRVFSNWFE